MASHKAKQLYDLGARLDDAWWAFAPDKLKLELAALPSSISKLNEKVRADIEPNLISSIGSVLAARAEQRRIELEMKDRLLTDLFNDQLIATGYRESPSISRSPVLIAAEYFDYHDPDWRTETFTVRNFRYGAIRITDPLNPKLNVPAKPQKGSIAAIRTAIETVCQCNSDFCNWPRKIACDAVRKELGAEDTKGNGLSDKNISKAIVAYCGPRGISI